MRLLICAGGTGGGVYPALAVLQALENEYPPDEELSVLWVGSEGGMEAELVSRAGVAFDNIPAAGVHGVGVRALPGNLLRLSRGYRTAQKILKRFDPQVLFFTGGYVAVPVAVAGKRVPSLLFVPDIEPGLALKFLRRFSDRVALTAAESKAFFPGHTGFVVTGYPARPELQKLAKPEARKFFDLDSKMPVLLVVGGSSGARSINRALLQGLPELLRLTQVIHVSGKLDWPEVSRMHAELLERSEYSSLVSSRYRVFPYLHDEMGAAFSAADLAVSRAGASTLGELPLYGLPAILVPYPHAWRYQKVNADYLAQRGAARILADEDLVQQLVPLVHSLLTAPAGLNAMSQAMQKLANPQAAGSIARELVELGTRAGGKE